MEKNLLPIGVANSRPNHDLNGYGSRDTLFSNCYFEVYQDAQSETQKVFCIKRPGISSSASTQGTGAAIGAGLFTAQPYAVYNKGAVGSNIFHAEVFGSDVYIYHFNGSNSLLRKVTTKSIYNRVNFTNIGLPDDTYTTAATASGLLMLFKDRTNYAQVNPTGSAASDLTRAIYLNNRVFVGDRNSGQIFQSKLGDYADWTLAGSEFITVESYGGMFVDIARYNNFIVAFKEYSTEFFEDVANQNGSVLGRVGQAIQQVGCVHPNTIVDTGSGELIWLGMDEGGNRSIVKLSNSFQLEPIHDQLVAKSLNLTANYDGSYAYLLNANGHQFYVLTLKQTYTDSNNASDIANVTFVYDIQNKIWTHWYSTGETSPQTIGSFTYGPLGRWNVTGACRNAFNSTLVQDYDTGIIYQLDDVYTTDKGGSIRVVMRFGNIDLGTQKRKFINKLTIYADGFKSTISGWNAGQQFSVNLSRGDGTQAGSDRNTYAYPHSLYALGAAKQFTLTVVHLLTAPMRVSAINIDYDIGEGHGIS